MSDLGNQTHCTQTQAQVQPPHPQPRCSSLVSSTDSPCTAPTYGLAPAHTAEGAGLPPMASPPAHTAVGAEPCRTCSALHAHQLLPPAHLIPDLKPKPQHQSKLCSSCSSQRTDCVSPFISSLPACAMSTATSDCSQRQHPPLPKHYPLD